MSDGAEFFARARQKADDAMPDGMSVWEYKRLKADQETEFNLSRNEPKRERLKELQDLGLIFPASELAAREATEREAAIEMQNAIEEQERAQRHQKPKASGSISPTWHRERLEG